MDNQQTELDQRRIEAENVLTSANDPDDLAGAHLILGVLNEKQQDWKASVESYIRCLAENPTSLVWNSQPQSTTSILATTTSPIP